jgi:hypothetical protein
MSRGADRAAKRSGTAGLIIPPLSQWQEAQSTRKFCVDTAPNSDRRAQFVLRFSSVAKFLVEYKGRKTLPAFITEVRFKEMWYLAAIVRDPLLFWSDGMRHTPQTLGRINQYGRTIARYLNPHWSNDCLKRFLESDAFRLEVRDQIAMISDLGRYEDWIKRLPDHKASRDLV